MASAPERKVEICNCFAIRQAARQITQFYDQRLAHTGLRTTQYSILARLDRLGPLTIGIAVLRSERQERYRRPEEKVLIG